MNKFITAVALALILAMSVVTFAFAGGNDEPMDDENAEADQPAQVSGGF